MEFFVPNINQKSSHNRTEKDATNHAMEHLKD